MSKAFIRRTACIFCLFVGLILHSPLFAAESVSDSLKNSMTSALSAKKHEDVVSGMLALSAKTRSVDEKKTVLRTLASFEERLGKLSDAARHFHDAAHADASIRDDNLLLDSARCRLLMNDTSEADSLVRSVLLSTFDPSVQIRSRVYAAWISLLQGNKEEALAIMKSYIANPAYDEYASQLLFTLWWVASDLSARDKLLSTWPLTLEAALIRGEAALQPSSFWMLMERSIPGFAVSVTESSQVSPEPAVKEESVQSQSPPSSDQKTWQQVGFFKSSDYADELVAKLRKAGFQPIIRNEKRPSGTVYFSVLVPEDAQRSVGMKLKNAGYESFLVIDQ